MVHYVRNLHHLRIVWSLFLWYFKRIFHCALIQFHTWAKVIMSNCARIFCKFRVLICFKCLEMIDIVVYFPPCRNIFIGHIIINYRLGSGNWIHVLKVAD